MAATGKTQVQHTHIFSLEKKKVHIAEQQGLNEVAKSSLLYQARVICVT